MNVTPIPKVDKPFVAYTEPNNDEKYIKVEWPESQRFMENPDVYIVENSICFVPESVYGSK